MAPKIPFFIIKMLVREVFFGHGPDFFEKKQEEPEMSGQNCFEYFLIKGQILYPDFGIDIKKRCRKTRLFKREKFCHDPDFEKKQEEPEKSLQN